ncbi:tyrosine-protein phosphatase non-receptor type 1-like isoform X2 [Uloborus diversus]|uniref:tyrosine-protein phosphatase non-receptor type 1-like isoform X2 n=1 Tax=Uloborus diversus TaxID=327109 RepID=UPI002409A616|nr:tyrosine-protein phosphatase non-receptor type 1-like isoform X2 [Uloborus diversus]
MERQFFDIDKRNAWGTIFQEIRNESNNLPYIIKDAKKVENKNLNRYRDVNPFDHSRVRLQRGDKDYINASLVTVSSADRSYILTQGPLPVTIGHFWLMVWEQKSKAVLMLNRIIEKNAVKCHQYWPDGNQKGGENDLILTDVKLKVTFLSVTDESYYIVRKFLLTDLESLESRTVLQFHYITWPDFGVPESPAAFLNFLFAVRKSGALNSNYGPPVVHCSAGIGRSGTFCLVDSCLVLIEKSNDPNAVDVQQQLLEMRHYRMGLIQTPDQLRFSYLAIIEGAKIVLQCDGSNVVPLVKENPMQINNNTCDMKIDCTNVSNSGENEISCSPPPLPPRSAHSIDDLKQTSLSVSEHIEYNGDAISLNVKMPNYDQSYNQKNKNCVNDNVSLSEKSEINNFAGNKFGSEVENSNAANVSESPADIRRRGRKEREEKVAAMVQNIKKKQKESEMWGKRRSKKQRRK